MRPTTTSGPRWLESADLLFEFIDRVSQLFSDTYESAGPAISEDERRARGLLARACACERAHAARTSSSPSGSASS